MDHYIIEDTPIELPCVLRSGVLVHSRDFVTEFSLFFSMLRGCLVLLIFVCACSAFTSLNHYVNYNDDVFKWNVSTPVIEKANYQVHNLYLTSQVGFIFKSYLIT